MRIKNKNLELVLQLTAFAVVFYVLGYLYDNYTANVAERAAKPLNHQIEDIGGKLICSQGHNGKGLDNSTPWHESYYYLPQREGLEEVLKDKLRPQGVDLISTQQFKDRFGEHGHGVSVRPDAGEDTTKNSYYIYKSNEELVNVNIIRNGQPYLRCPYKSRKYVPTGKEDGTVIIEIMWRK